MHVSTNKFELVKRHFEGLLGRAAAGFEGSCLLIHGRAGAGKTHIINQLTTNPDLQPDVTAESFCQPVLKVVAPVPCTLSTLGLRILQELGYIPRKKLMQNELWDRVEANLKSQGVSMLVIDEMQNVLIGRNVVEQEKIAMMLKSLMVLEENPIQLVLSGSTGLPEFIQKSGELYRRSYIVELTPRLCGQVT
jgi:hypothetical protein